MLQVSQFVHPPEFALFLQSPWLEQPFEFELPPQLLVLLQPGLVGFAE